MKYLIVLITIISASFSHAATSAKKRSTKKVQPAAVAQPKSKLSTDISFDDMFVGGKYQYADEALAVVENEKILHDLLGVRMDFKDRLKRETKRR